MLELKRIVLIDDNDADNEFHEIIIREAGFVGDIVALEDPLAVVPFFAQTDLSIPTYVFLDINMPMRDGFQVAEDLSSVLDGHPTVIVMMLTSSNARQDRERAAQLPVIRDFFVKPLTVQQAEQLIAKPFSDFFP